MNTMSIPPTIMDQNQYEFANYAYYYTPLYFESAFLQIMSAAAGLITSEIYQKDLQFEMLYSPMNTGEYTDNTAAAALMILFLPLMLYFISRTGSNIVDLAKEEHEDKIIWILKRIGMRETVEIFQIVLLYLISFAFFGTLAVLLIYFTSVNNIDFFLLLIFVELFAFHYLVSDLLFQYGTKGSLNVVLKILFYGGQFMLSVLNAFYPNITAKMAYSTSVFPFMFISWITKFNFIAANKGQEIRFDNLFTESVVGDDVFIGYILIVGLCSFLFMCLCLAYSWPLVIAPDPDRPLRFYYPLTCGCCRG